MHSIWQSTLLFNLTICWQMVLCYFSEMDYSSLGVCQVEYWWLQHGQPKRVWWGNGSLRWRGALIVGFSACYGWWTNTIAEVKALLDGPRVCKKLQLKNVEAETDSAANFNAKQGAKGSSEEFISALRTSLII